MNQWLEKIARMYIAKALLWITYLIIPLGIAQAHEAWLQPTQYQVEQESLVKVDVMAGQNFSGHSLSFNPVRFSRLQLHNGLESNDISGRIGDLPAVQFGPAREGLHSIIYQTTASEITYKSEEQFRSFAQKEGVEWILKVHKDKNLPVAGFSETFYRYCKTLVGVGHSNGKDQKMGMPFELVALQNPLKQNTSRLTVQLFWAGNPEPGLLSVYQKSVDNSVRLTAYQIDRRGQVTIPLMEDSAYLLNVVKMEPLEQIKEGQPVWKSHWASLTFATGS